MSGPLISHAGPSWHAVMLVVVGMVIGALVVQPVMARVTGGSVEPAATTTKWASCPSVAFYPGFSPDRYGQDFVKRLGASEDMYCGLTLPHGATITAAKFHLYDSSNTDQVDQCALYRVKLDPPDGSFARLAGDLATGVAFDGGYVALTDTSINDAVVNNRLYAYLAKCRLQFYGTALAIIGVSVRYRPA